jgi:pimeloyl-ACP methyl ester carboxylesterase
MARKRDRLLWAGAGLAALGAAGAALQHRHVGRVRRDPAHDGLRLAPVGRVRAARSSDGTRLHVELFGPEDGEQTVVLAHGWTEQLAFWIYVIRELSPRGLRVAAYDLRGHGRSEPAASGDYSLARFGEDLEAVLEACLPDGRRATLVGHSLGAMTIVAWAEHHEVQRRAEAAALLNTGVGDLIAEQLLAPVPAIARGVSRMLAVRGVLGSGLALPRYSTPLNHALIRYIAFGPAATPAQVAFYERMLIGAPPAPRAAIGIAMSEMELHHALPRLTVPTLMIASENDRLTPPAHARRIAGELPALTKLVVLPKTGHMSPIERPREVSEAIAELAASVASPAAGLIAESSGHL